MIRFLVIAAMLSLLFSTACSKEEGEKVYSTPEGKVEMTRNEGDQVQEMTVKTKEGTATLSMGAESIPGDLGVPIYPGVDKQEGGTWSMSGEGKEGFSSALLYSADPIDKVAVFYKDKLKGENPQTFEMAMPDGKMINISIEKGEAVTHIVLSENKEKGGTNIQITKTQD